MLSHKERKNGLQIKGQGPETGEEVTLGERTKLTAKQAAFVEEYLVDLNATQAALRIGYSKRRAGVTGCELVNDRKIAAAIAERMKARERRTEVTQDRVLQEYARLAFFDPRKLLAEDGTPRPINELDADTAAAIAGLDIEEATDGRGVVRKYRVANKIGALDSVARHLGMFNDSLNLNVSGDLAARLERAKARGGRS